MSGGTWCAWWKREGGGAITHNHEKIQAIEAVEGPRRDAREPVELLLRDGEDEKREAAVECLMCGGAR